MRKRAQLYTTFSNLGTPNRDLFSIRNTSILPIEYQYLTQEYIVKLHYFYKKVKYEFEVSEEIILTILKRVYSQYFLPHFECNLKSHITGIKYCRELVSEENMRPQVVGFYQPQAREYLANAQNLYQEILTAKIKEYLPCNVCYLDTHCSHPNCKTPINTTTGDKWCSKHMNCPDCHFNRRFSICLEENCNSNKRSVLGYNKLMSINSGISTSENSTYKTLNLEYCPKEEKNTISGGSMGLYFTRAKFDIGNQFNNCIMESHFNMEKFREEFSECSSECSSEE